MGQVTNTYNNTHLSEVSNRPIDVNISIAQNQEPIISFSDVNKCGNHPGMSNSYSNITRFITESNESTSLAKEIKLSNIIERLNTDKTYNPDMKQVVLDSINNASTGKSKIEVLEKGLAFLETEKQLSVLVQEGKMSLDEARELLTRSLSFGCSQGFSLDKLNTFNESLKTGKIYKTIQEDANKILTEGNSNNGPIFAQEIYIKENIPETQLADIEYIKEEVAQEVTVLEPSTEEPQSTSVNSTSSKPEIQAQKTESTEQTTERTNPIQNTNGNPTSKPSIFSGKNKEQLNQALQPKTGQTTEESNSTQNINGNPTPEIVNKSVNELLNGQINESLETPSNSPQSQAIDETTTNETTTPKDIKEEILTIATSTSYKTKRSSAERRKMIADALPEGEIDNATLKNILKDERCSRGVKVVLLLSDSLSYAQKQSILDSDEENNILKYCQKHKNIFPNLREALTPNSKICIKYQSSYSKDLEKHLLTNTNPNSNTKQQTDLNIFVNALFDANNNFRIPKDIKYAKKFFAPATFDAEERNKIIELLKAKNKEIGNASHNAKSIDELKTTNEQKTVNRAKVQNMIDQFQNFASILEPGDNEAAQDFNDEHKNNVVPLGEGAKARVEHYEGTNYVRKVFKEGGDNDNELNVAKEITENIQLLSEKDQKYLENIALPKGIITTESEETAIIYDKAEGKNFQDANLEIEWAIGAFSKFVGKVSGEGSLDGNTLAKNMLNWLKDVEDDVLKELCIGVLPEDRSAEKVRGAFENLIVPLLQKKESIDSNTDVTSELRADLYKNNIPGFCKNLQGAFKGIVGLHKAGFIYDDLKPDNMMMGPPPKVIDLGECKDMTKAYNPQTVCASGYAPPESDNNINTQASDVYKMGICVAKTLLGEFGLVMNKVCAIVDISDPVKNKILEGCSDRSQNGRIEFLYKNFPDLLKKEQLKQYIPNYYSDNQLEFLGNLIKDCINPDLSKRPTSEQMLVIFEQFSAEPNADVPDYNEVKQQAVKDHPKELPPVLMEKLFSKDATVREQAFKGLEQLVKDDPSYVETPTYGLAMLRHDQKGITKEYKYDEWKDEHEEANKQLLNSVCLEGMELQGDKGIPLTLHKMQFLKNKNPEFKKTPMYGLYLFKKGKSDKFEKWRINEKEADGRTKIYSSLCKQIYLKNTSFYTVRGIGLSMDDIISLGDFSMDIKDTATYKLAQALKNQGVQLTQGKELEELQKRVYVEGATHTPPNGIPVPMDVCRKIHAQTHCLSFDKAKELVNAIDNNKGENLGAGSFGTVYKVEGKDGKTYAVKISKLDSKDAKADFDQEKEANEYLQFNLSEEERKYFVGYHGGFEINGKFVFITEYIGKHEDGRPASFEKYIKNVHGSSNKDDGEDVNNSSKENLKTIMGLLQQGFERIAIEQRIGLLNRDIKPENMMVARDANGNLQLKSMDYGTACVYGLEAGSDKSQSLKDVETKGLGTPNFMSPEVSLQQNYTFSSDVYSMGISLLDGLFGGVFNKEVFKFPWKIAEYVQEGKLSKALENKTFDVLEKEGVINKGSLEKLKTNLGNDDRKITFLANLVADCTAYEPKDRISAQQAAYLLGEFNKGKYDYTNLKTGENYPPKAIPMAISNMISSKNKETQKQGIEALKKLILADPSYIETNTFKNLDNSVTNEVIKSNEYKLALERLNNKEVKDNASITENATQAPKVENSSSIQPQVGHSADIDKGN